MKSTSICPKCAGRKVYAVSPVQQTYCDAQGSLRNFGITGAHVPTGKKTLLGGKDTSLEIASPIDAWVCATCGYTEWYAPGAALRKLERMVGTSAVRVTEADGKHDPPR